MAWVAIRSRADVHVSASTRGDQGFRDENAVQVLRTFTLRYELIVSIKGSK
jgi:hypothetical protein